MWIKVKRKIHGALSKNPGLNYPKLIRDVHRRINGKLLQTELTSLDITSYNHLHQLHLLESSICSIGTNLCYDDQTVEHLTSTNRVSVITIKIQKKV